MSLAPIGVSTYLRLRHLKQTIEALKVNTLAKESDLYIFSDAARPGDEGGVDAVRKYIDSIKGFKKVHVIKRIENSRKKNSRDGIVSLLDKYGKCIFLEEDIVTAQGFLKFMNESLNIYEKDKRIFTITGYSPPINIPVDYCDDVFILRRASGWGFGIWHDRYKEISYLDNDEVLGRFSTTKEVEELSKYGEDLLNMILLDAAGKMDALDVKIFYYQFLNEKYTVYPRKSLVRNIGLDGSGIHCCKTDKFDVGLWDKYEFKINGNVKLDDRIIKSNYRFRNFGKIPKVMGNLKSLKGKNKSEIDKLGEGLIFIISQPRAGSTLLQRIFAGHPEIHTTAEPWIMLHPIYALKRSGLDAEYESSLARQGLDDFLMQVPEGEELYIEALREMANVLYNKMINVSKKKYFLDKTPRYYFIIPELYRVFPKAKFIFLMRNPIAVLSSVLKTWCGNILQNLVNRPVHTDLIKGPYYLLEGIKRLKEDAIVVHYEKLVQNPKEVMQHVCNRIGIQFNENMLEYGKHPAPEGRFGDSVGVHKHISPVSEYIDKWTENLASPDLIEFAQKYLLDLGPEVISRMGYSYQNIKDKLEPKKLYYRKSRGGIEESSELNQQGEDLFAKDNFDGALDAFTKALDIDQNNATTHNNLGVLYYNRGDKEKAFSHYKKAAELQPANITFQKNLADFYYVELGRVEEAMEIYVEVLNINPEDIETLLIIGHICVALKEFDDAKDFYSRILIVEPWNKDAKQFLEKLEKCQLSVTDDRLGSEDIETAPKECLVSAIVSTYNSERFIRGCLEDLENQTIADRLEIIVVNSGSEHNEDKIIKEFQEKYSNIKYIKTDKRETVYAAWNRGIKAATGKYITNANTDDRHRKDAFEVMINILETHPETALVYADIIITETENETFESCTPVGYFNWMNWKREDLLNKGCFMGPQPMWRRDVHDEYGYFDDSFVTSGDYEFWLRISQTNIFLHLPVRLGLYLRSPGSIEHLNREKQREENNKIFKVYSESHSSGKIIRRIETEFSQDLAIELDERRESGQKMIKNKHIDVLIKQEKNAEAMHQIEEAIALYGVDDGFLSAALKIRDLLGPIEIDETKDKKYTVSLCMIVKNEEEHLARCLKSVKPVVNEMIVIDTGSEDRTIEIARAFGAKVYSFKWTGDFSEARNISLSKASGNWTFHLDADEVISPLDYEEFGEIIRQSATKRVAFLVNTRNYTKDVNQVGWTANDGYYDQEESATGWMPSEKVRLFRNESNIRFEYPIHEVVEPSLKRAGYALKKCIIPVHHYGKLDKEKSDSKREVYYQTGRKKLDEMGDDTIAIRELAIQAEILGKHDEAIELWERFIAIEPNVSSTYINMGISYCGLGKFEDVLETAKKAMKLEPDLKEGHYNYALGKLYLGSAGEAVSILEKLLERLGEYPPAQFLSAAAYCCDGQKDKGISVLKKLQNTSMGSDLPVRCYELAKGFVSSQRHDYVLMLLEAAIESKNSNKEINELYFKCLKMADDNEKTETNGITFCEKWKSTDNKSDPGNKVIAIDMIQQAEELNQKGQTDNAIETALKAIGSFPEDKRPYYLLAQILINAKRYKDAFDVLMEMPHDEKDVRKLELIGYCKEGMEQYDEAKDYANQALSLNPSSASAMNLKGVLAYNQGDNSKAEGFFKQAIEFDPGYGEPYTNLGAIRWEENRDDALRLFEKGFILSPTIPDIIANYHTAVSAIGEFERAEGIFQDAGSLYPNNKMIKYQFVDMLIKQEKYTKAMHRIEEAIALFGVDDGVLSAALKVRDLLGPKEIDKRKKNTVSLCMIAKNEEKHLARCLNSVKSIVDEMIVVDTGSTDMTKDIAKVFGAKVYDFEWNDDFSEVRNFSISKASGKWNLVMDADEAISSLDYNKFKKIIKKSKPVAYQFTTRNYTLLFNMIGWNANDEKYINENAGVGWTPSDKVRLFPNKHGVRFEYPIHELIEPSLKKAGLEVKKCKIPIHHYGKLDQKKSDDKDEIYYQIGKKKLHEMGDNEVALCELAIQAGTLGKHEESIELWERLIKIQPETALAFVNMGTAYAKLGKYEKAVSAASKALEINPEMVEAHYNYAFAKVHLGQVKDATLVIEKLLSRFSEYPPAEFLLAVAYCLEAREAKWRKSFKKLKLSMGYGLAVACHEFAKGLVSTKRPDYAVTLLEAAIESKNSNKEIDELYSKCLEMMNIDRITGTSD